MSNTAWAYRSSNDDKKKKKKKKKKKNKPIIGTEEANLASELFGTTDFLNENSSSTKWHDDDNDEREDDTNNNNNQDIPSNGNQGLFYEDLGISEEPTAITTTTTTTTTTSSTSSNNTLTKRKKAAAWEDEDDEEVTVDLTSANRLRKLRKLEGEDEVTGTEFTKRLREQHEKIQQNNNLSWAKLPSSKNNQDNNNKISVDDDDDDHDDDSSSSTSTLNPLQHSNGLIDETSNGKYNSIIPSDVLKIERLVDANKRGVSKSTIQSVRFNHVTPQLMLTAGFDKTLRLFSIDGKKNPKVRSVFIRDLPITTAEFSHVNSEIILAGRRSFFYTYDLESGNMMKVPRIMGRKEKSFERFTISPNGKYIAFIGNNGYIVIVSGKTKQWIRNLKMNGNVRNVSFSKNGTQLITSGDKGEIYIWDMKTFRCLYRHQDHGCLHSSAIAAIDDYYACGSGSGVVNLYENQIDKYMNKNNNTSSTAMLPSKTIMSLTTRTDVLRFNHDESLLAISSQMKKDSLKIFHVPSKTVYSNWPTAQTPLHYVTSVDFSANSGMLAIGNDRGKVLLYRLKHYHSV